MVKCKLFLLILIFLMRVTAFSQQAQNTKSLGRIRGQVVDETTQNPLVAANILIESTRLGTAADTEGKYLIEHVLPGIYNVRFMMMGYETRVVNNVVVNPGRTTWQKIELKPTVLESEGVVVTAGYFHEARDGVVSNRSIDFEEIRSDPGSAEDIQRVVQALPSVVSGADQDNEIIVRGGMPGENLFVMDNIEIPNPNHFGYQGAGGGPINMINTHLVRRVDFYAGAFPARYGDKASSVMDISLREGDREHWTGHAYLGMAGVGAIFEGPISGGRGSYIMSARKSYLDLILSPMGLTAVPHYYNLQGKVTYDLNKSNQLMVNGIFGDDKITIEEEDAGYGRGAENVESKSYQYAVGMTLRTLLGEKGFSKLTLSQAANHWDHYVYYDNGNPYYTNLSTEIERTLKYDLTYLFGKPLELNMGGQIKSIRFNIHEWAEADTIFLYNITLQPPEIIDIYKAYGTYEREQNQTTTKAAAYAHVQWIPHPRFSITAGIRIDYLRYTNKDAMDPRLGLSYRLDPGTRLNFAFGRQSQSPAYIQLVSHPLNKDLDYKITDQVVVGLEHLFREDIRGTMEVFYKDYSDVPILLSSLTPDPFDASYGRFVNQGKGYAKGLELFLQKKLSANYHFTLSYAYSVSQGHDPRFDTYFNWDYDYRHIFTFIQGTKFDLHSKLWYQRLRKNIFYKIFAWLLPFGDQVEISFRWRYLGGRPYTKPLYYPHLQRWLEDETVLQNQHRYPAYHRMDIRLDRRFMFQGWNMVTYIDIMNVYGRDNIWAYSYQDEGTVENIYQFKVFPVGGITIEF